MGWEQQVRYRKVQEQLTGWARRAGRVGRVGRAGRAGRNYLKYPDLKLGWAHPNRVLDQAVLQKFAAGHPKFGAEREVRASPWGFALIASRLDALRVPENRSFKQKPKKLGAGWRSFRWYERAGSAMNAHKQ
jgi:hypothetical protein